MTERDTTPLSDEELAKLKASLEILANVGVYLRSFDGLVSRLEFAEFTAQQRLEDAIMFKKRAEGISS